MENKKKIFLGLGLAALVVGLTAKKKNAIKINYIVDDLAKHPTKVFPTRSLSSIDKIVLHHYAGNGTPYDVATFHSKCTGSGRCWPGIGYHFTIDKDGTISQVNKLDTLSYHVIGQNTSSIGVALEGNFQNEAHTPQQLQSIAKIISYLRSKLPQPLEVYQHSDFANKPYDASLNLSSYKLAGINEIFFEYQEGFSECKDGTYTNSYSGGTCSHHGGYFNELDTITEADLETMFYDKYYIGEWLQGHKVGLESFKRYGDSNLIKEKLHWIKKGGTPIDDAAQQLTMRLGVEVTPEDIIEIILDYPSPKAYIDELKYKVLENYKRQQGMHGISGADGFKSSNWNSKAVSAIALGLLFSRAAKS